MALIGLREVSWGFGGAPLLENITFNIEKGERVGLLGRNGAGKSTIFRLLNGRMNPDSGEIWRQQGITVSALEQEVPPGFDGTIFDTVAGGLDETGSALSAFRAVVRSGGADADPTGESARGFDPALGWELLNRVESVLSRTGLDPDQPFAGLSAGMKRRTLFARAIARDPDLLLLDEPTNHLDIDAIAWMEDHILKSVPTLMFITHDREFLKRTATRILELDRGHIFSYACGYATYLERRQAALEAEEKQQSEFDKKLSREEAWIRQGIKARRTRNEGRVRALEKLRDARRARRGKTGNANLQVQTAERTGKMVIEAENIRFSYDGKPVIDNFSTLIMRGDRVGMIGPNGAGKTTLLNILLQRIAPDAGTVRHGTNLQVAYFDQLRAELDETKTVSENVAEGNDHIVFNGEKRHVLGYLKDFLFSPERARTPVHILSGGEKHRLLLARLFTRPANVLVLDEPTNDLDIETLELLEDLLFNFTGTVLLVSHDRAFLNNVVTSSIVFEEEGRIMEYAGGYDDWRMQREMGLADRPAEPAAPSREKPKARPRESTKLGYKEMRELETLPQRIEAMEAEHAELYAGMSDPDFYKKGKEEIARVQARLEELDNSIEHAYARWEALEKP